MTHDTPTREEESNATDEHSDDTVRGDGDWWDCPVCGGQTEVDTDPADGEPDRYCTECDWSSRIPRNIGGKNR